MSDASTGWLRFTHPWRPGWVCELGSSCLAIDGGGDDRLMLFHDLPVDESADACDLVWAAVGWLESIGLHHRRVAFERGDEAEMLAALSAACVLAATIAEDTRSVVITAAPSDTERPRTEVEAITAISAQTLLGACIDIAWMHRPMAGWVRSGHTNRRWTCRATGAPARSAHERMQAISVLEVWLSHNPDQPDCCNDAVRDLLACATTRCLPPT